MAAHIKYPIVDGMKQCGDCNQWKPISDYKKSRNHLTSRCIPCLKIYAANYRKRPEVKEASSKYHKEYIKVDKNREDKNAYLREYRKLEKTKIVRNASRRAWMANEKQKAVDYKGGCCVICGYKKCIAALEFHHLNPLEKEITKDYQRFEDKKNELDKCILVCNRCHREIHAGVIVYE